MGHSREEEVTGITEMYAVFQENGGERNTIDFTQLWVTPWRVCNNKKREKIKYKRYWD